MVQYNPLHPGNLMILAHQGVLVDPYSLEIHFLLEIPVVRVVRGIPDDLQGLVDRENQGNQGNHGDLETQLVLANLRLLLRPLPLSLKHKINP